MTANTIQAKQPDVDGRFLMTAGAVGWCAGQNGVGVAFGALYFDMGTIQDKEIVMIKGIHQRIPAVMTGQAVIAKQAGMVGREIRLAGRMTLNAVNQIGHQTLLQMAVMTGHLRFVKIFLMAGQTKICQLVMLKVIQAQERDIGISPLMFGVAVLAAGGVVETAV
jgi:hypothetical protein